MEDIAAVMRECPESGARPIVAATVTADAANIAATRNQKPKTSPIIPTIANAQIN